MLEKRIPMATKRCKMNIFRLNYNEKHIPLRNQQGSLRWVIILLRTVYCWLLFQFNFLNNFCFNYMPFTSGSSCFNKWQLYQISLKRHLKNTLHECKHLYTSFMYYESCHYMLLILRFQFIFFCLHVLNESWIPAGIKLKAS